MMNAATLTRFKAEIAGRFAQVKASKASLAPVPAQEPPSLAGSPVEFHRQLAAVKIDRVPVMTTEWSSDRVERAEQARALFKRLGLKGASVTKERASMCFWVNVNIPGAGRRTETDKALDQLAIARTEAILKRAFPAHKDRTDDRQDCFMPAWIVRIK